MAVERRQQINELIRTELAKEFSSTLELPAGSMVSITKVKTSKDLHYARIFISILPEQTSGSILTLVRKQLPRMIENASPRLVLRCLPKFAVVIDETERKAAHIEALLDSLK